MPKIESPSTHRGQGAGAGAGDGLGGRGQDAAVGHDHDVLAGELLLQLTHQAGLDLVEGLEQAVRNLAKKAKPFVQSISAAYSVDEVVARTSAGSKAPG